MTATGASAHPRHHDFEAMGRDKGRGKPFLGKGNGDRTRGNKTRDQQQPLNHLSPSGWWDSIDLIDLIKSINLINVLELIKNRF